MSPSIITGLLTSSCLGHVQQQLERATHELGFCTFTALYYHQAPTQPDNLPVDLVCLDNPPPGSEIFYHDEETSRRDPVMRYLRTSRLPIVWNRQFYAEHGCQDLHSRMAPFGFVSGIGCAMHMPRGAHFLFGLDSDLEISRADPQVMRSLADVYQLCTYTCDAISRIASPFTDRLPDDVALEDIELEILHWVCSGTEASAIADLLSVDVDFVLGHATQAAAKLNAPSPLHAALRALRLGLISP